MTVIYLNPIYLPGQKLPPSAIAFLSKMLPLILSRQGETCIGCFQQVRVPRALWISLWLGQGMAGGSASFHSELSTCSCGIDLWSYSSPGRVIGYLGLSSLLQKDLCLPGPWCGHFPASLDPGISFSVINLPLSGGALGQDSIDFTLWALQGWTDIDSRPYLGGQAHSPALTAMILEITSLISVCSF